MSFWSAGLAKLKASQLFETAARTISLLFWSSGIAYIRANPFCETLAKFKALDLGFNVLLDTTRELIKKFGVHTTPDCYIFNQSKHLIYSGRVLKDLNSERTKENTNYIALALDQLVGGLPIEFPSTDPIGSPIEVLTTV